MFHNDARNTHRLIGWKFVAVLLLQEQYRKNENTLFFSVQYDNVDFFLEPRVGNWHHTFHSKFTNDQIVSPPRLLNKEMRSMIEKISKASGNYTITANAALHTTGIMLSNKNIAYLSDLCIQQRKIGEIKKTKFHRKNN